LYNATLTKDPKKKISSNLEEIHSMLGQPVSSIDEMIDYTREAKKKAEAARWKISGRIEDMLKWFDRYSPGTFNPEMFRLTLCLNLSVELTIFPAVLDVMVQQQPRICRLLWGSIRASLSVSSSFDLQHKGNFSADESDLRLPPALLLCPKV
jgi:hypothetical protein